MSVIDYLIIVETTKVQLATLAVRTVLYVCFQGYFWRVFNTLHQANYLRKAGDHPNFRKKKKHALGAKRPFSELWERSRVFSEQLSEFRK